MGAHRLRLTTRSSAQGPPLSYRAFVPARGYDGPPLLLVHGNGRAATRQFRAFLPAAIARNVPLIAPTFSPDRFPDYQSLAGAEGPLAARRALLTTLDDAWSHLGVVTDEIDMVGFSGGAQFAHRFAMLAPDRVGRAVVASAGWYTYLDDGRPFPRGTGRSQQSGGRNVDVEAFLRVPVHVLVGERDVRRDVGLRTGESIDRRQGRDRLTRALRWMDHLEEAAGLRNLPPQVSFDLLPDTGHSFAEAVERGGLVGRAFEFLHPTGPSTTDPGGPALGGPR